MLHIVHYLRKKLTLNEKQSYNNFFFHRLQSFLLFVLPVVQNENHIKQNSSSKTTQVGIAPPVFYLLLS